MITATDKPTVVPVEGFHDGIEAEIYHALPMEYASNSRLTKLARSPAHLRESIDNPEEPTPALVRGDAAHLCVLQPDLFAKRYVVADRCSSRKKDGIPCSNAGKFLVGGEWLCGVHVKADRHEKIFNAVHERRLEQGFKLLKTSESGSRYYAHDDGRRLRVADHAPTRAVLARMVHEGSDEIRVDLPPYGNDDPRRVLPADDYEACRRMTDAVYSHPRARSLLTAIGSTELTGIFRDPESGVLVKMRIDHAAESYSCLIDLKTTQDARPGEFSRTIFDRGYHRQGALYLHGAAALGRPYESFAFIAVEPEPPYGVKVYQLEDDTLEFAMDGGEREPGVRKLLTTYAECLKASCWPCYDERVERIGVPPWAMR